MQIDKRLLRRIVVGVAIAAFLILVFLFLWRFINPSTPEQRTAFIQTMGGIVGGVTLFVGLYFTWRGIRDAWQQTTYKGQTEGLQNYFQEMGKLLNEHHLLESPNDAPVRAMAQGGTWAVIQMVDTHYKYFLLQFLYQARLVDGEDPVISLRGVLTISPWTNRPSVLAQTTLSCAILRDVDIHNADLSNANLGGADLSNANLSGANLKGANVTEEQLAKCKSLEGATMPNGQKYEDWLKSKGRGEDGENSSPS